MRKFGLNLNLSTFPNLQPYSYRTLLLEEWSDCIFFGSLVFKLMNSENGVSLIAIYVDRLFYNKGKFYLNLFYSALWNIKDNGNLELCGISHKHWRKDMTNWPSMLKFQIDYRRREEQPRPTCYTKPRLNTSSFFALPAILSVIVIVSFITLKGAMVNKLQQICETRNCHQSSFFQLL